MREIRENLKKEEIALCKGYMRWYRVIEDELRLFVNADKTNDEGKFLNKIYWDENRAELCINDMEYCNKFYERFKQLNIRIFIRFNEKPLYSEYEVKDWGINNKGIEVKFK